MIFDWEVSANIPSTDCVIELVLTFFIMMPLSFSSKSLISPIEEDMQRHPNLIASTKDRGRASVL